ncbi:MAG: hypothetical protein DI549_18435 [Ancylobacter novellus]|uniref:Helix-turn-helix domain-containing protein n=1 Tax=Ancylobacter novellus TaxID=921 RepID=A0A2W5QSC2_ANCNO|nr:MAG: hypothetical protein DI549_18435 [Ancylobacter novellus]
MNTASLPEAELQRSHDFVMASLFALRGTHDHKLIPIVLEQYAAGGEAVLPSHSLAARFGTSRRTICAARRRLVDAGFIRRVRVNDMRQNVYVPCLERADEYRAHLSAVEQRDAA